MSFILPTQIFDQHIILLGKTRSGKSSAMRLLIEYLLDKKEPVTIIDPKGDWWGLKSSASGKREGYPVVIFGGTHADVPLNARSGIAVAELTAIGNRPCIIDLGGWMPGERTQFWIDFASTFFRVHRGRRWLAIDEIHNLCPKGKVMDPNAGKMLHWSNRLASEGLGKGISLIAASQRPQKVHNDFLTSCETLVGMRVIHKADRDAIKDWIDGCGDSEKGTEVLHSIASMKRGEAWVWSPEAEFGPKRIQFPMFSTYDSFKPQKASEATRLKGWADVDLSEVKKKLEGAIREAEANDPAKLKAEIRSLQTQLKQQPKPEIKNVVIGGPVRKPITHEDLNEILLPIAIDYNKVVMDRVEELRKSMSTLFHDVFKKPFVVKDWKERLVRGATKLNGSKIPSGEFKKGESSRAVPAETRKFTVVPQKQSPRLEQHRALPGGKETGDGEVKLGAGARRLLSALVSWSPNGMKEGQWRSHAGLRKSGTFSTYKSALRSAGFITEDADRKFYATQEGITYMGDKVEQAPTTTDEVLALWKPKLGAGARRILDALVEAGGETLTQEELTEKTGLQKSGTFSTYISALRTAQLVITKDGRYAANKETLFL